MNKVSREGKGANGTTIVEGAYARTSSGERVFVAGLHGGRHQLAQVSHDAYGQHKTLVDTADLLPDK